MEASKVGLCPWCNHVAGAAEKAQRFQHCEHLWTPWIEVQQQGQWARQCSLCAMTHLSWAKLKPTIEPEYDISWCSLD
jgi:hypothetical protein